MDQWLYTNIKRALYSALHFTGSRYRGHCDRWTKCDVKLGKHFDIEHQQCFANSIHLAICYVYYNQKKKQVDPRYSDIDEDDNLGYRD